MPVSPPPAFHPNSPGTLFAYRAAVANADTSDIVELHFERAMRMKGNTTLLLLLGLTLHAGGCSSMTPGKVENVQPFSDRPLAGNAYLLRGFLGIWSTGIDNLGKRIEESGIRAHVYQEDQWRELCAAIVRKYKD